MPSFPMRSDSSDAVLRPSRSGQLSDPKSNGGNVKQQQSVRPHPGGPSKSQVSPFHLSSSPSVTLSEGKENGQQRQQQPMMRHSQPPSQVLHHQRSGDFRDPARKGDTRQGQTGGSPRTGRREEASRHAAYPSRPTTGPKIEQDIEDINKDFERLLVSLLMLSNVSMAHIER
jgi:hypothetical protein